VSLNRFELAMSENRGCVVHLLARETWRRPCLDDPRDASWGLAQQLEALRRWRTAAWCTHSWDKVHVWANAKWYKASSCAGTQLIVAHEQGFMGMLHGAQPLLSSIHKANKHTAMGEFNSNLELEWQCNGADQRTGWWHVHLLLCLHATLHSATVYLMCLKPQH
jgi:hypothetical protein